jgi:uncharacterized protein YrrD
MRSLGEILNLPVLNRSGKYLGIIAEFVLDAKNISGAGFLVKDRGWYAGMKFLPKEGIIAIGKEAVIASEESLEKVIDLPDIIDLLENSIDWKGLSAFSINGDVIGKVEELLIDEKSLNVSGIKIIGIGDAIPREDIIALGPFALLLDAREMTSLEGQKTQEEGIQEEAQDSQGFEAKQVAYLIGKKLTRDIILDDGTLVASKGEVVTWQIVRKIKLLNRLQELINSVEM